MDSDRGILMRKRHSGYTEMAVIQRVPHLFISYIYRQLPSSRPLPTQTHHQAKVVHLIDADRWEMWSSCSAAKDDTCDSLCYAPITEVAWQHEKNNIWRVRPLSNDFFISFIRRCCTTSTSTTHWSPTWRLGEYRFSSCLPKWSTMITI